MPPKKKFRLNAHQAAFTYPQVHVITGSKQLGELLIERIGRARVRACLVARESHADGGAHYHCYLRFRSKVDFSDISLFTITGDVPPDGSPPPHDTPHFESRLRSPKDWIAYLHKEDPAPFLYGDLPGATASYISLGREGKTSEAIESFVEGHPLQFIIHKDRITSNITSLAPRIVPDCKYPGDWLGVAVNIFKDLGKDPQTHSIILSGGSGIGKTQLCFAAAQALGKRPLLVRHRDALKDFVPGDFLIFDDWDFGGWTRAEILHLIDVEEEAQVNVKHSYARIPGGTNRVFTTNFTYSEFFGPRPDPAIDRRVQFIELGPEKLYLDRDAPEYFSDHE